MPIIVSPLGYSAWSEFESFVQEHCFEAPIFEIEEKTRSAARKFLRESHCWRQRDVTLLTSVAGQRAYTYAVPTNGEINRIHSAWIGATEVEIERPTEREESYPDETASTWKIGIEDGGLALHTRPAPVTSGEVVKGSLSFVTSPTALGIPTWIFDEWGEEIAALAAYYLVLQAKRPWTNPQMAPMLMRRFDEAVLEASNKAGPVTVRRLRVRKWP